MSLAGLDTPAVVDAHFTAQSEATGWLLVNYISRDTVQLLRRGTGGVSEARAAIDSYEEKSPLFGLVQYRRKKIILKYVPEGTSRLLQVRLTVQFQSVLDAFTPHDTVFSFAIASEFTESALALCTMLLPTSNSSTTSGSSLRRRRLNEISEDGEEYGVTAAQRGSLQPDIAEDVASTSLDFEKPTQRAAEKRELEVLPASALLAKALLAKRKEPEAHSSLAHASTAAPISSSSSSRSQQPPQPVNYTLLESRSRPSTRNEGLTSNPPDFRGPSPSPAPIRSVSRKEKGLPATPELISSDRQSPASVSSPVLDSATSQHQPYSAIDTLQHLSPAETDSISQWNSQVTAFSPLGLPKKKKLGPRPHVEPISRPRTSGTSGASESTVKARPVANLPTSIRVPNRATSNNTTLIRPDSRQSSKSVPGRFPPYNSNYAQTLPPLPSPSHIASFYRPESRPTASRAGSVTTEGGSATPEKLRLMKALQLRKRNMLVSQRTSGSTQATSSSHAHSASLASTNTSVDHFSSISSLRVEREPLANIDERMQLQDTSTTTGSPTMTANVSENHSTAASSFTSHDAASQKPKSISSDTSSSITPKAGEEAGNTRKQSTAQSSATVQPPPELKEPEDNSSLETSHDSKINEAAGPKVLSAVDETYIRLTGEAASEPVKSETSRSMTSPDIASQSDAGSPAFLSPNIGTENPKRRKGIPQQLRIPSSTEVSEISDSDSFMDEIQNATVEEAKPIHVARSPGTPVVAKVHSRDPSRSATMPLHQPTKSTGSISDKIRPGMTRKISATSALPAAEPPIIPLTKKATLGQGISKRIKALEVLSSREATSPPRQTPANMPSSRSGGFTNLMKRSSLILNHPTASADNSPQRIGSASVSAYDRDEREGYDLSWRQGAATQIFPPTQKGETISVTARIIRDNQDPFVSGPREVGDNVLHRSPLVIEHDRKENMRPLSMTGSSLMLVEPSAKSPRSDRGDKRFSFSSHRSSSQTRLPLSESASKLQNSNGPRVKNTKAASDANSILEEKSKGSRAARLMARVIGRRGQKNVLNSPPKDRTNNQPATIAEGTEAEPRTSASESLLHVVDIGDVNVQFPETLLWKRRFMRIDDQGYLIFSPPASDAKMRGVSRKYHLAEFMTPRLPETEREEMAWSIVLDLPDGKSVQCACESKLTQQRVLHMLVDAHSAYHQLYGQ